MIMVDVFDFVSQHVGKFVFGGHQIEHAFADVHRAAGKREGVEHVVVGQDGERIRQMAMRVVGNVSADAADVFLEPLLFRGQRASL